MAADTETPPVETVESQASPPTVAPSPDVPKTSAEVRSTLGRGLRLRAQTFFPAASPTASASNTAAAVLPSTQPPETQTPSAAAGETPSSVLEEPTAPQVTADETPPTSPPSASLPAPAPEKSAAPAAVPSALASPEAAPAEPPPAALPDLPPEFVAREYQERYSADPLLRRELLSIWRQPGLSDVAKARAMEKRVAAADNRIAAARANQEQLRTLRQSGNLEEWARQVELQEAQEEQRRQWAVGVTQLLARTLGADPEDDAFVNAGAIEPGEPEELRAVRFAEWAIANSPIGRAHLAAVTNALRTEQAAALAARDEAHAQTIKDLNRDWEQKMEAARTEALAQGRGTQAMFPPRATVQGVPVAEAPSVPRTIRDIRGMLGAGLRLRQEAARAVPPS